MDLHSLSESFKNLPPLNNSSVNNYVNKIQREKHNFTGIKDVDLMILSNLNDKDLFSLCIIDKDTNMLCKDETFWRNRFVNRFGAIPAKYKPVDRNWRNHYLKVIHDLGYYNTEPWSFFNDISWIIYNEPTNTNVSHLGSQNTIKQSDEYIKNAYWMLELGKDIIIEFPIDRYQEIDKVKRRYTSDKEFTPAKVLELVYNFYQEPLTRKELEIMQEADVEDVDEFELDDAEKGEVKRIDLLGGLQFFEGFDHSPFRFTNKYGLSLGS